MDLGLGIQVIGRTGGESLRINDVSLSVERLRDMYFNSFKKVIEQDL